MSPKWGVFSVKMTKFAIPLLFWLGLVTHAQGQTPQLLLHATQCLANKSFLQPSRAKTPTFGYFVDEKSYPGDSVIYVIQYASPTRTDGLVFALFLSERDGVQGLDIQNNASFVLSKDEPIGVAFEDPPLGGAWTQGHLASAIKRIEKQPRFSISAKILYTTAPTVRCEAYTDSQPKK